MDDLEANPDDCKKFEPNPFKKEKCKQCGFLWTQHKGVISQDLLNGYLKARQQVVEDKSRKEAEAKAQAEAKRVLKKKQSAAVEDEWLFDGVKTEENQDPYSSDDELGFQMFNPSQLSKPTQPKEDFKQLKVVNLIDWGECDVPDPPEERQPDQTPMDTVPLEATNAGARSSPMSTFSGDLTFHGSSGASGASARSTSSSAAMSFANQELMTELQHLRQMLADANEEKAIQVAIVRDEVAEKQLQINELRRQRAEMEATLKSAETQLQQAQTLAEEQQREANRLADEVTRLNARLSEVDAKAELAEVTTSCNAVTVPQTSSSQDVRVHELLRELRLVATSLGVSAEARCEDDAFEALLRTASEIRTAAMQHLEERRLLESQLNAERQRAESSVPTDDRETPQTPQRSKEALGVPNSRHTAQALKEIRLHAEQQLAWVLQRMSVSRQADLHSQFASTVTAGAC